ncbi:MAG: Preprotein translocase, SecE subunit [Candidatus Pacebacteria bacterium GW2011_GWA1_46_10]|nr:MAG: Preprotein translocase, SecE subunit [Candidatus Pacebacteria bacterium GW2011_GWA1_46_10]HCR81579.1 preprotein translocase subunit SecE [Candidatus Paceibacterota bacterium]
MKQVLQYFREVVQELQKVSWPTKEQTYTLTAVVISVTLIAALYIGGLDFLFQRLMSFVLGK